MVCQYMKKHPDYRQACLASKYFDPNGRESLAAVNERWGHPVKLVTLYRHMSRHQSRDIQVSEELAKINGQASAVWQRTSGNKGLKTEELENTIAVVEAPVSSNQTHEVALDEFIAMGRAQLKSQNMSISAANFITAIKTKAEIERTTKDRKLDMLKSMFAGAAPAKKEETGGRDEDPDGA